MAHLEIQRRKHDTVQRIPLLRSMPLTIGRAETNGLRLDANAVSREHCVLDATTDPPQIRDVGSRAGIMVNGERVSERTLQDGDEIRIGPYRLRFFWSFDEKPEDSGSRKSDNRSETEALRRTIDILERATEQRDREVASLQQRIDTAEAEARHATELADVARQELDHARAAHADDTQRWRETIEARGADLSALREQLVDAQAVVESIEAELQDLRARRAELEQTAGQLTNDLTEAQGQLEAARAEAKETSRNAEALTCERNQLKADADQAGRDRDETLAEATSLREQHEQLLADADEASDRRSALMVRLEAAEAARDAAEEQLAAQRIEEQQARAALEQTSAELLAARRDLTELRRRAAEMTSLLTGEPVKELPSDALATRDEPRPALPVTTRRQPVDVDRRELLSNIFVSRRVRSRDDIDYGKWLMGIALIILSAVLIFLAVR